MNDFDKCLENYIESKREKLLTDKSRVYWKKRIALQLFIPYQLVDSLNDEQIKEMRSFLQNHHLVHASKLWRDSET